MCGVSSLAYQGNLWFLFKCYREFRCYAALHGQFGCLVLAVVHGHAIGLVQVLCS